jgi:hypothetical protein
MTDYFRKLSQAEKFVLPMMPMYDWALNEREAQTGSGFPA